MDIYKVITVGFLSSQEQIYTGWAKMHHGTSATDWIVGSLEGFHKYCQILTVLSTIIAMSARLVSTDVTGNQVVLELLVYFSTTVFSPLLNTCLPKCIATHWSFQIEFVTISANKVGAQLTKTGISICSDSFTKVLGWYVEFFFSYYYLVEKEKNQKKSNALQVLLQ